MDDRYKDVKAQNLAYFSRTLEKFVDEHQAVAQSQLSHRKRFEKILELGDFSGHSLLDVGCGLGGFYEFLQERGIKCRYTGVDINPGMIAAARERLPEIKEQFLVRDIIEEKLGLPFDYVISIGPLNLQFADDLNLEISRRLIREMFRLARVGAAISMTSGLTQRPGPGTFYYDPLSLLADTFTYCTNVRFDHSYLPHDFTLFLYKRDLYT